MKRHLLISILVVGWSVAAVDRLARLRADDLEAGRVEERLVDEIPIDDFDRGHWAYRPVENPVVPDVKHSSWPRTPIDHFIMRRMESASLMPAGEAERTTLIRRLSFDLTGLPPTPGQVDAFLKDDRPGAYERLVDSLLASPQFGRRWGQYWLDLARFAETDGFEHDKIRPTAWQYRDWVIDALNDDMPYDRFVRWQLAGDVLAPRSQGEEGKIATAFCLSGPDMPDINSQQERKHVLMNEITSTVGAVFLSLQVGCAQCHDHKFDAFSQADFYRLRAFFDPAVSLKKNESVATLAPLADPDASSHLMVRGDWRREGPQLEPAFPRIVNAAEESVAELDPAEQRAELARWLTRPEHPLTARSIVNRVWQHHFGRGLSTTPSDFGVMGDEPSHPELLDYLAGQLARQNWSLKRLHRQIVLSSVYRLRSVPPQQRASSNQVTNANKSAIDSAVRWAEAMQSDPENRLLTRYPRRRLDAESLRDAMLAVSGSLNHQAGGPGVMPPLPREMTATLLKGQWQTSRQVSDHYRRSIYLFARRNLQYPFFSTFDRPAANMSCAMRQRSTTAVQSLLLFNSEFTFRTAGQLAESLRRNAPHDPEGQCRLAYQRLFSRTPAAEELRDALTFLEAQRQRLEAEDAAEPTAAALTDLCRALLNVNEFLYID